MLCSAGAGGGRGRKEGKEEEGEREGERGREGKRERGREECVRVSDRDARRRPYVLYPMPAARVCAFAVYQLARGGRAEWCGGVSHAVPWLCHAPCHLLAADVRASSPSPSRR